MFKNKVLMITGGTGSFGNAVLNRFLKTDIGEIRIRDYAIHPGKGVGKELPEVGIASIIGIVDSSENSELFFSRSIRLSFIMDMAKVISKALMDAYNLTSGSFPKL